MLACLELDIIRLSRPSSANKEVTSFLTQVLCTNVCAYACACVFIFVRAGKCVCFHLFGCEYGLRACAYAATNVIVMLTW